MRVDVITVFPDYLAPLELGVLGRARRRGLLDLRVHDLRRWTHDAHRTVDDAPYGGSPGMLMLAEPWFAALREVTGAEPRAQGDTGTRPGPDAVHCVAAAHRARPLVVVPSPCGRRFDQSMAVSLAIEPWLVICCGRYEGVDQRVLDAWADLELSIGDYVLAGGEAAALVLLEVTGRLLPGVLRLRRRRLLFHRPAGGTRVHPACGGRGPGGAAGPALGRPRCRGALAARAVARPDPGAPAGPARRPAAGVCGTVVGTARARPGVAAWRLAGSRSGCRTEQLPTARST